VQPKLNSSEGMRMNWFCWFFPLPFPLPFEDLSFCPLSNVGFSVLGFLNGGSSSLDFTAIGFGCSKAMTSVLFMQTSKCSSQGLPLGPALMPPRVFSANNMNNFLSAASICWKVVREKPCGTDSNLHDMIFSSHLS
jgi:hypothetical protein